MKLQKYLILFIFTLCYLFIFNIVLIIYALEATSLKDYIMLITGFFLYILSFLIIVGEYNRLKDVLSEELKA